MFKNKKIVALALLAVMLIVPFASAFAAVTNDWIRIFQDAVNAVPNLVAESNAVLAAATLYAKVPTALKFRMFFACCKSLFRNLY